MDMQNREREREKKKEVKVKATITTTTNFNLVLFFLFHFYITLKIRNLTSLSNKYLSILLPYIFILSLKLNLYIMKLNDCDVVVEK